MEGTSVHSDDPSRPPNVHKAASVNTNSRAQAGPSWAVSAVAAGESLPGTVVVVVAAAEVVLVLELPGAAAAAAVQLVLAPAGA